MKKKQDGKKIRFSKIAVSLMYINVIGFFAFVMITKDYPPTAFIVAWMSFWCVQAIVTAVLEINKRGNNKSVSMLEAFLPYVNDENMGALIEYFVGFKPKYKKAKIIKKLEEECEDE